MFTTTRKPLNDFIECSVCTEVYNDPRTLPCLHTFCLRCCEGFCRDKLSAEEVECPLCREKFVVPQSGVGGLRKNFVIESLKQNLQFGDSCATRQSAFDIGGVASMPSFCDQHTNKTLDWYCVDCGKVACASCRTKDQKSHNVIEVDDVTKELRTNLTSHVVKLETLYKKWELDLNKIENEETTFIKSLEMAEAGITDEAKRLQQLIERRKSELLAVVTDKKRERLKQVENFKEELRQQMAFVKSWISYTTELVTNRAEGEIAREANSLGKRASKLLELDRDIAAGYKLSSYTIAFAPRDEQTIAIGHLTESTGQNKGLTTLDKELYVHYNERSGITVYDTDTYNLQRRLPIPGFGGVSDMASCRHYRCVYISDWTNKVIRRIEVKTTDTDDKFTKWNVEDEPCGLSVNADHNVIVTCWKVDGVKVFTTFGKLLKVIDLKYLAHPKHTIQLTPDKFVVCHGGFADEMIDPLHRVCIVDGNGNVQQSFGRSPGSDENNVKVPTRLALVNGFIFVADQNNQRVLMLSPILRCIRTVVSKLSGYPTKMCFDEQTGRLYLDENKWKNGAWTTGHVNVYDVGH